jgi:hypothetical protein
MALNRAKKHRLRNAMNAFECGEAFLRATAVLAADLPLGHKDFHSLPERPVGERGAGTEGGVALSLRCYVSKRNNRSGAGEDAARGAV